MILVLGGGWTGSRICLRDPSRFITTTRNADRLAELSSLGIKAVNFDLLKEKTWPNLPPKSDVEATICTFEILSSQLPQLERLFEEHIPMNWPIICFGTSSCFQSKGYMSVVDETAPLTSVTGASLADRVNGEEWILAKGATVLHISGIVGDSDASDCGCGPPRTIKSFLSRGFIKNGLRLINFIHINDIYKITLFMIDQLQENEAVKPKIKGQRILTSCGAFRVQEWVKALNMDPLPEIIPPDDTMKTSKILSTAKLHSILPKDYKWTLPVAGVEPVSRGL